MKDTQITQICHDLVEFQKIRTSLIKMMNAQRSQAFSFICRTIGYDSFQDEKERKKKWKIAGKIFKTIAEKELPIEGYEYATAVSTLIVSSVQTSLNGLTEKRKDLEKKMKKKVEQLPIFEWWTSEKGRSHLGLAVIIGEAGDLRNYELPAKLWKRFGLAVMDGVRQGGLNKNAPAELWIEHGYCKRRRSAIWTIGDCLIKTNGKDGRYRRIYNERKEYEIEKLKKKDGDKYKPIQAHRRAQRYMEKKLLKDLWNEWNGHPKKDEWSKIK